MIAGVLGAFIGILLLGIFAALAGLIVALFSNAEILKVRIFNKTGSRTVSDKEFHWYKDRFVLLPQIILTVDMNENYEEDMKKVNFFDSLIFILMSGIYSFVIIYFFIGNPKFFTRVLFASAVFLIVEMLILLIKLAIKKIRKADMLGEFVRPKVMQLKSGATFDQLNMAAPEGAVEKADKNSKVLYLHICFDKALWAKNFTALNSIVRQMDAALRVHGPNSEFFYSAMTNYGFYDILFYSSYVNQNVNNAIRIYNVVKPTLDADMDANGRRVLAYYQFYVTKQTQEATMTLNQAVMALQNSNMNVLTQAEYDLEKRLIEELQDNMTRVLNPGTFTRPVIENTFDDAPLI